jgi:hypothetical protein
LIDVYAVFYTSKVGKSAFADFLTGKTSVVCQEKVGHLNYERIFLNFSTGNVAVSGRQESRELKV